MKYSIKVTLQPCKGESKPIRLRVSFGGNRVDLSVGVSYPESLWVGESPKRGTRNANRQGAAEVQRMINDATERVDSFFARCDLDGTIPTPQMLRDAYGARIADANEPQRVMQYAEDYLRWYERVKHPSESTLLLQRTHIYSIISEYAASHTTDQLSEYYCVEYQEWLEGKGYRNSTIDNYVSHMRQYIKYLREERQLPIPKQIVGEVKKLEDDTKSYLTSEELSALYGFQSDYRSLQLARDYFIFGCFCGLRYSDIRKLKKAEVSDTHIRTTTRKTGRKVAIEINKYTKEILDKYHGSIFDTALPPLSLTTYDSALHTIFKRLGFDTPTLIEYYQGDERVQEVVPKYQILASHSARRTFVVQCLTKGIPPLVIIRWTGHKDLKTLSPYIAIVDEQKKNEMQKLDFDLGI